MAAKSKPHLVILVHGIRDIARWQSEVGRALESEGLLVEHTSYGRMNLVEFLLPIDFFRKRAVARVWTDIQHARMLHPEADVSIIAHSFGTYVVTRILKEEFALQLNHLILCGSVVKYDFPFEQIQNRFAPPLLNDVGTNDPWPAFAEAITFGYGSAGTYGFNRPGARDRYHNGQGHGYFLDAGFATKYWAPFLRDGTLVEGDANARQPPLPVRLLSLFKLKWLLAALVLLAVLFFALRAIYAAPEVVVGTAGRPFGFWGDAVPALVADATAPCPVPVVCSVPAVASAITGRRYVAANPVDGEIGAVYACAPFAFPADGEPASGDPVLALERFGETFGQCVATSVSSHGELSMRLLKAGMTEVRPARESLPRTMWLCGCSPAETEAFRQKY